MSENMEMAKENTTMNVSRYRRLLMSNWSRESHWLRENPISVICVNLCNMGTVNCVFIVRIVQCMSEN